MLKKSSALLCISICAFLGFSSAAGAETPTSELHIEEGTAGSGFCGVDGWIHNNHAGFTGEGFANTQNTLGNGIDYSIYVDQAGSYDFEFGYALGAAARSAEIQIADTAHAFSFEGTGSWRNYETSDVHTLELPAGVHTLRIEGTGSEALPNLDWMTISGPGVDVAACDGTYDAAMLELLSPSDIDWIAGSTGWLNLTTTSDVSVENVAVTVIETSAGVTFSYPADGEQSGPSQDSTISPSEVDYSSIKFETPGSGEGVTATIQIDFEWLGVTHSITETLVFSNIDYEGDDFAILTESGTLTTSVDGADANWLELSYLGLSPVNTDLEVAIEGDLDVYYPQGEFTALHTDKHLHAGERDVARVWFDPATLESGNYTLTITIEYVSVDGEPKNVSHDVAIVVS